MLIKLLIVLAGGIGIELYFIWQMHALVGLVPTLLLMFLTGIAGLYLLRLQGMAMLRRLTTEIDAGRLPGDELLDGMLILLGGLLLLTPGFISDLVGFFLLVPASRAIAKRLLILCLHQRLYRATIRIHSH